MKVAGASIRTWPPAKLAALRPECAAMLSAHQLTLLSAAQVAALPAAAFSLFQARKAAQRSCDKSMHAFLLETLHGEA